jgi:S-adenosylmethionine/arginine decarboxylase-like enzyme
MKHLLFRAYYDPGVISENEIAEVLFGACDFSGAHIRTIGRHDFNPVGVSVFAILSESHASVHSWPEKNFVVVDYFSCSEKPDFDKFMFFWSDRGFRIEGNKTVDR